MIICPCKVSYLADDFIKNLQHCQIEVNITVNDVLWKVRPLYSYI